MSLNSKRKLTKIIGQRKALYRQRAPEPICVRKETVDIDILETSRGMVAEKSCNLSEQRVDLPREKGSGTG